MKRINLPRLLAILEQHPGAVQVSAVARTLPRLLRKSRADRTPTDTRWPAGVEKLVRGRFILANRYQANVRRQRQREGHPQPKAFRAGQLWRGHGRRIGKFLAKHESDGRLYVVARPQSDSYGEPVRLWERWIDLATGEDIRGETLADLKANYLRDVPRRSRKQGVRRRIPYRVYRLEHVHSVCIDGEVYVLEADRSAFTLGE